MRHRLLTVVRVVLCLVVLVIFVLPLVSIVATAFSATTIKPGSVTLFPSHFTFDNLRQAWHFGVGRGLANSLIVEGIGLTLQLSISALAAYALARKRFRGKPFVLLLILSTMILPEEVIAIPLYLVLRDFSLLNSLQGIILPIVGWALPVYVLTQFMETIPLDLEEAARIDGAGELRIFFRVILPLCKPALGTCAVFGFLMIWDQYLLPLLVAQSPGTYTLPIVLTQLQNSQEMTPGVVMAGALIVLLPSIIVYLVLQRFFQRGILTGSLKG